jgi:hypothetical protein
LCPLCPFMCLPVSRLFWVSSLAYPNLLGTKGYIVVVVVVWCLIEFVLFSAIDYFVALVNLCYVCMLSLLKF